MRCTDPIDSAAEKHGKLDPTRPGGSIDPAGSITLKWSFRQCLINTVFQSPNCVWNVVWGGESNAAQTWIATVHCNFHLAYFSTSILLNYVQCPYVESNWKRCNAWLVKTQLFICASHPSIIIYVFNLWIDFSISFWFQAAVASFFTLL